MPTGSVKNSSLLINIFREVYLLITKSCTAARGHGNIFFGSSYQRVLVTLLSSVASRRFKILTTVKGIAIFIHEAVFRVRKYIKHS